MRISWKSRAVGVLAATVVAVTTATPAHAAPVVGGEIGYRYTNYYGGENGALGLATTPETRTPNGKGVYQVFQGGSIYWSPWTGARKLNGELRNGYGRMGFEGSYLGFPTSDEQTTDSRRGMYQEFEGGTMYWAPWSGAHALRGAIEKQYETFAADDSWSDAEDVLGFPTSSELRTPNGRGAYNTFQWGSIYWSPGTGAWPVYGAIRDAWGEQGYENGRLGFPVGQDTYFGDYEDIADLHVQEFQDGSIIWAPDLCVVIFSDETGYYC